jgi:purine nucleoside phosphorylase
LQNAAAALFLQTVAVAADGDDVAVVYRANIDVLKRAGVTDLVSLAACGSFKEESPPGTFVLIDQFVGNSTDCRQKSSLSTAHC